MKKTVDIERSNNKNNGGKRKGMIEMEIIYDPKTQNIFALIMWCEKDKEVYKIDLLDYMMKRRGCPKCGETR